MSPTNPNQPATASEVEASAEAAIAATAVTLETLQAAIETEAQVSEERQLELLSEVKACRQNLETLSKSAAVGAESPAIQQMLVQMGQLQTSLEAMQADLAILAGAEEEVSEEPTEAIIVTPETDEGGRKGSSLHSTSPSSKQEEKSTSGGGQQSVNNPLPESSPSPTPKRKHYVKI